MNSGDNIDKEVKIIANRIWGAAWSAQHNEQQILVRLPLGTIVSINKTNDDKWVEVRMWGMPQEIAILVVIVICLGAATTSLVLNSESAIGKMIAFVFIALFITLMRHIRGVLATKDSINEVQSVRSGRTGDR